MGTWVILHIPAPTSASVSRPIINLLLIEKSMILLIMDSGINSVRKRVYAFAEAKTTSSFPFRKTSSRDISIL